MSNKYSDPDGTRFFFGKGELSLFNSLAYLVQLFLATFVVELFYCHGPFMDNLADNLSFSFFRELLNVKMSLCHTTSFLFVDLHPRFLHDI
jgi:hypothetical protein